MQHMKHHLYHMKHYQCNIWNIIYATYETLPMQHMKHHLCNIQKEIHMLMLMNDTYAHAMQVQMQA
jgi:hypothetical protein